MSSNPDINADPQAPPPGPSQTRRLIQPLWDWVAGSAFLVLVTVFLMGIVANVLLWPLGVPRLFWHESWRTRLFAGLGVGMFVVNVATVGFLLATRRPWITDLGALWPRWRLQDPVEFLLARYLALTSGVLVAAAWLSTLHAPHDLSWPRRLALPAAVTLGAVLSVVGLRFTRAWSESQVQRHTLVGRLLGLLDDEPRAGATRLSAFVKKHRSAPRPPIPMNEVHRAAAVFFLAQLAFFVLCGFLAVTRVRHVMSAGLVIAMFLSAVVSVYGAVRWWAEDLRFLCFIGMAALWVGLAAWGPYRHTLYDLRGSYDHPVPVTVRPPPNTQLLDDAQALRAWGGREGALRPLVVLAVDGGGIRAATWVVSMLTTLEQDIPRFPYHVRVITGASGGMVGAAYYVATLQQAQAAGPAIHALSAGGRALLRDEMISAISKDGLEPAVQRLVFRDVSPIVWRAYADRGYALEQAWQENTGSMHQTLRQLAAGEAEGWRPSLIFSPMIVEDGRRLLISNLDLGAVTTAHIQNPAPSPVPASLSALELAKLVPETLDLRISSAARLSASFPYVSPAAEVPLQPLRRVVDAGYYDEHGVALATAWILANEATIRRHASRVVLIQIPDQRTDPSRLPNPCAPPWWSRGLSDLVSPPQGVLSGWSAGMNFRNDEAVQTLGRILNAGGTDFFRSYVFEPYDPVGAPDALYADSGSWDELAEQYCEAVDAQRPVSLSWHMVDDHRRLLRSTSPNTALNCKARRDLTQWWTGSAPGMLQGCRTPMPEPSPITEQSAP